MSSPAIGIDLGTCYSCVAVWQEGKVNIILNDRGNRRTPSHVAFTETGRLIGEAARQSSQSVFCAKRLIGRCDDPKINRLTKLWPFMVFNDLGRPRIQVECEGATKIFAPEEISSMILLKLKETAEAYLEQKVTDAVIAVPASFTHAQRQATLDAAEIAGLNVLRLLNDPPAVALAYAEDKNWKDCRNVLIFDLGGGFFDVSILTIDEDSFEVKAFSGDTHLGGEDFDNCLVNFLLQEFLSKYRKDVSSNPRAVHQLKKAAEEAKCTLSSSLEAVIEINPLIDGIDFQTKVSRTIFEHICSDLFDSILNVVKEALNDAKLDKSSINDVVLTGGSSRIPKVRAIVEDFFRKPVNILNSNEAVAHGAAIQAAILKGLKKSLVLDAISHTLTAKSVGGETTVMVKKNSTVPLIQTQRFSTNFDYQTNLSVQVYEGERKMIKNDNLLGTFEITEIPRSPEGVPVIEVSFHIDPNSTLKVTATVNKKEKDYDLLNGSVLSKQEKINAIGEAKRFKEDCLKELSRIIAKSQLEAYILKAEVAVGALSRKFFQARLWMNNNSLADQDDYQLKCQEIEDMCRTTVTELCKIGDYSKDQSQNGGREAEGRNTADGEKSSSQSTTERPTRFKRPRKS